MHVHSQKNQDSTHVFLRHDTIQRALIPPYSGPQRVIAGTNKTFKIIVRGRLITVTAADSSLLTCLKKVNTTPVTHQTILAAIQQSEVQHFIIEPGVTCSFLYIVSLPPGGVIWGQPYYIIFPSIIQSVVFPHRSPSSFSVSLKTALSTSTMTNAANHVTHAGGHDHLLDQVANGRPG